jgi:CheY-like chemotaxis protein
MQVLLIDDDRTFASTLSDALKELEPSIHCTVAGSRASALTALHEAEYDLILCDLSLPTVDGALDEDALHGIYVYQQARRLYPGTPIFFLSGHSEENIDFVAEALTNAPREDLFGNRVQIALTQLNRKAKLDDCIIKIVDFCRMFQNMDDDIEIHGLEDQLSASERRLLRIFARRHNGAIVDVTPLSGGLSSSKTLRVRVRDPELAKSAIAVAKLGSFEDIDDEGMRYRKHVAPLLGVGSFTPYADEVRAGTGSVAGRFYTLAEDYGDSLFDILSHSESDAVEVLDRVVDLEKPWTSSAVSKRLRVEELRRNLIDDATFRPHMNTIRSIFPLDQVERSQVTVKRCSQHGDLHGLNILVSNDNRPVLIDYGDVGTWCACYDLIVLELSILFHPAGCKIRGVWPSAAEASQWENLDAYCSNCPFPEFIRRCRAHASELAAARREVLANVYSFAVRQLKYPNTDKSLVLAVAECAARGLLAR